MTETMAAKIANIACSWAAPAWAADTAPSSNLPTECKLVGWPELFNLSPLFVSLVMANEWEGAFLWPMKCWHLSSTVYTIHTHILWSEEGATCSKVSLRSKDLRFLHLNKAKEFAYVHTVYSEHSPASRRFCLCLDIIPNLKSNRLGILRKRYISCIIINFASGLFHKIQILW